MNLRRFVILVSIVALLIFLGGGAAWLFERNVAAANIHSYPDGVWWALVTIMTVGYGDKFPVTFPGRIVATVLMFAGVGVVSVLTATIASFFVERRLRERAGMESIELTGHHVICGWNDKTGRILAGFEQANVGRPPVDIVSIHEGSEEKVVAMTATYGGLNLQFVRGDYTSETVLKRARVEKAASVTFLVDEHHPDTADERTVIAATLVIDLNPGIHASAELHNARNRPLLERLGVDNILVGGSFDGHLLANAVVAPGVQGAITAFFEESESGGRLREVEVPLSLSDQTVARLSEHFNKKGEILIGLARRRKSLTLDDFLTDESSFIDQFIRRKFQESERNHFGGKGQMGVILNPSAEERILPGDRAIVIA